MVAAETAKSLAPMTILVLVPTVSWCRQTADVTDVFVTHLLNISYQLSVMLSTGSLRGQDTIVG